MSIPYEPTKLERKNFIKMIKEETIWYFLLKIWDGRYAAFWHAGLNLDHERAVNNHEIDEDGSPFSFVSHNLNEVRNYIYLEEIAITREQCANTNDLLVVIEGLNLNYSMGHWFTKKHRTGFSLVSLKKLIKLNPDLCLK